jgi:hypothetical protein
MKKWMLIMGCALVVLMVGTVVAAWEDEAEEDEYGGITEEIWCELTACTGDDMDADDKPGVAPLDDPWAWGCCEYQRVGDGTTRCFCEEPDPGGGGSVSATAFFVGRNGAANPTYDLIAVKGTRVSSTWSYSVCGGCQKQYMDRLLIWGIDSSSYGTDYLRFIDENITYGNGTFTTWWPSQNYWLSVTAAGRAGSDSITGSRQADWLFGGDGNDSLWGMGGYDWLWGLSGTDYCNCGGGWGEDSPSCDTEVNCD